MSIGSDAMPALGGSQARPWCSIVVRSTRCWRYRSDACRRVIRLAFSLAVQLFPLRSRLAFAVARLCHGASACLLPRPPITAKADSCIAAAFSIAIRRYSAGEHVPLAIMTLRRAIVSHDAIINSATIRGSGRLRRELSFAMVRPCEEEATAGDEAASCQAYNPHGPAAGHYSDQLPGVHVRSDPYLEGTADGRHAARP